MYLTGWALWVFDLYFAAVYYVNGKPVALQQGHADQRSRLVARTDLAADQRRLPANVLPIVPEVGYPMRIP